MFNLGRDKQASVCPGQRKSLSQHAQTQSQSNSVNPFLVTHDFVCAHEQMVLVLLVQAWLLAELMECLHV